MSVFALKNNSRRKSRVDVCQEVTGKVTLRCEVRDSAGQKVTPDLTVTHAPGSQKSHVFPRLYKTGKRDFSDPQDHNLKGRTDPSALFLAAVLDLAHHVSRRIAVTETRSSRVYVIGDPASAGPVKIGTTKNLPARLAAIKCGRGAIVPVGVSLTQLQVLAQHPGGQRLERQLHEHYAALRTVGEWFAISAQRAAELIPAFLAERSTVEAVEQRGTRCFCYRCIVYPQGLAPGRRTELADPSVQLIAAVHAMSHARLGVDLSDDHVALPASHCDIDRATRLLEVLGSR